MIAQRDHDETRTHLHWRVRSHKPAGRRQGRCPTSNRPHRRRHCGTPPPSRRAVSDGAYRQHPRPPRSPERRRSAIHRVDGVEPAALQEASPGISHPPIPRNENSPPAPGRPRSSASLPPPSTVGSTTASSPVSSEPGCSCRFGMTDDLRSQFGDEAPQESVTTWDAMKALSLPRQTLLQYVNRSELRAIIRSAANGRSHRTHRGPSRHRHAAVAGDATAMQPGPAAGKHGE